jgi:ubiquinone/menaquinone biosynthesis C-methylase UbiE
MALRKSVEAARALPTVPKVDPANAFVRARYDCVAPIYDLLELPLEFLHSRWRRELWSRVKGGRVLEVGVGTGKSMPYYPKAAQVTAVDYSSRMLARALSKARRGAINVRLVLGDAQALPFREQVFDTAVAIFVLASIPNALAALREIRRVLRPGGRLLLLERVPSQQHWLGWTARRLSPIVYRVCGARFDREIEPLLHAAGFRRVKSAALWLDIVKHVEAFSGTARPFA